MKLRFLAVLLGFILLAGLLWTTWGQAQLPFGSVRVMDGSHQSLARVTHGGSLMVECSAGCGSSVIAHISSVTHIAAAGPLPVVQSPQGTPWNVTAHQGGVWTLSHVTSVTHVIGSVMLRNQAGTLVTVTGTALDVNCTGCSAASTVVVSHVSSVTHVAGAVMLQNQAGTLVTVTGTALDVNCTGCSAAATVVVSHVSSVTHVAAAGPLPVVQSPQGAASWTVTAHQGGQWNVAHVTSVTHVAAAGPLPVVQSPQGGVWPVTAHMGGTWSVGGSGAGNFVVSQGTAGNALWPVVAHQGGTWTVQPGNTPNTSAWLVQVQHLSSVVHVAAASGGLIVQANTTSANMVCHSQAAISQAASQIVIHGVTSRIYICGVVLVSNTAQSVSLVEGTGANCGTGTVGLLGGGAAAAGLSLAATGGFTSVAPFPWLSSATAGNNVCLLQSGSGTLSGVITYRGTL